MKECKRCLELVLLLQQSVLMNDLENAKKYAEELMTLLNGYDDAC